MDGANRREMLQAALTLPALGWGSAVGAAAAADQMAPGISQALARHRARQLSDVHYDLALDLTGTDRADGQVTARFTWRAGSGDVVLDFRGGPITDLRVNGRAVPAVMRNGHVRLPARALRGGSNSLTARFSTPIAAAGAAIIRFEDTSDGQTYLYTLLVPSDANLLFPCFDQPDLKARFRWQLTAPAGWTVLTNGKENGREPAGAAVRWRFAETAPISTYLAAFAAGPWASWTAAAGGGQPITLYARASRRSEVDAEAQMATNRTAVAWLADWFGVPFPFAKLDLLLAPAFPFGGMEHVGAVFYNEDRFVFREPPTLPQRLRRDSTIYHEISHQWFGDAVTMRWFDDLWLKEGFSTYMAARIQAALNPASSAWATFLLSTKISAYRADATGGTQPLWQALDNLDAAKSNYGPIVYNKAPAVIKQLAFYVGEDGFRRGLKLFLTRHAYGNATWVDLLGAVAEASGTDLTDFGNQYMLRAGMPLVETQLRVAEGRISALTLTQRPVRVLAGDSGAGNGGGAWPMKLRVRLGYHDRDDVVLDARFEGSTATVAAAGLPVPDYVWANDGDEGYGLFLPEARTLAWSQANVGRVADPLLRALLWNGLWDAVRERMLPPADYVALVLRELPAEADEQISRVVLGRAAFALTRYLPQAGTIQAAWETALITRVDDDRLSYGLRKEALDQLVDTARGPAALDRLRALLAGQALFAAKPIGQPTRWAIVGRFITIGAADAAALLAAEQQQDRSTEAMKDGFVVGAAWPDAAVKADYFRRYFDDAGLNEAWASESLTAFNAPEQSALTLPFLRPALDRLEWIQRNRRIFFLPDWIDAFIGGQVTGEALGIVDRFLAERSDLPGDLRRKILLVRDELERTVQIRDAIRA
ncbi:M1 family metallopeptidase [Sandarakinorhabdus rubra]|uniref:M1 family metallopeptidase n=1 Tax=Sandarakinorhabdus rubra TaxID=2672568 RepID=UPI001F1A2F1B|nr:M1 family aminopeptidase [Sandarakinorhabdus rubra]